MIINPTLWLAGWEDFGPYFRKTILNTANDIINKIIFFIEQIQEKLMTKFFNEFKKTQLWPIFSIFGTRNVFEKNPALSGTTLFIYNSSTMPKFRKNLWSNPGKTPGQKNIQKDGRTNGESLFHRTTPATTGVQLAWSS